jgi:type I restriction enzyme S subunit
MSQIPGWSTSPLAEHISAKSGNSKMIKGKNSSTPAPNLIRGFSASGPDVWVPKAEYEGDGVVVSAVGARCGKTFLAEGSWTAIANTHVLIPGPTLNAKYLWYLTNNENFWIRSGTAQPFVKVRDTLARPQPLPPLEEQRRIVAILEDHLSHLDAGLKSLVDAQTLSSQAMIAFLNRSIAPASGWAETTLGEISTSIRNGIFVSRASAEPDGIPILRIGSVRAMCLDLGDLRYTGKGSSEFKRETELVEPGDLLFTRYNGNPEFVAACAEVRSLDFDLSYPDKLIRVRIDRSKAHSSFVEMAASAGVTRGFLTSKVKTTAGQAGISGRDLREAPLTLPSIDEQRRIAEEFQEFRSFCEAAVVSVKSAARRGEALRTSLLASAFSGQLTGGAHV